MKYKSFIEGHIPKVLFIFWYLSLGPNPFDKSHRK